MASGYPASGATGNIVLRFAELHAAPDVAFWQRLTQEKLDVLRLDDAPIQVTGHLESSAAGGTSGKCLLSGVSFDKGMGSFPAGSVLITAELRNFNRVEEFRDYITKGGRTARVVEASEALQVAISSGEALKDPKLLRPMLIIAFADLKKYHFAYTVGCPVLAPDPSWCSYKPAQLATEAGFSRSELVEISEHLRADAVLAAAGAFLLVKPSPDAGWTVKPLAELLEASVADDSFMIAFVDPSSDDSPGWPLRNLLLLVAQHRPGQRRFLAFRDTNLKTKAAEEQPRSRILFIDAAANSAAAVLTSPPPAKAQFAGWTKIQTFDLTAFLDKKKIAADAVDLNVKLMKWRLLPDLKPEKMRDLRCLLLGAGTLGCAVARTLMGWGVRRITFVDSGKVAMSNPVRQSLFTFQDAAQSRPKAEAAAEAVMAIMPDAEAEAVQLEIPMPGHPHQKAEVLRQSVEKLAALIRSHDVVCMLTDSRESRWLPSLMVAAAQEEPDRTEPAPLGLTVALGFDSFLVSRQTYLQTASACYFCNDMSAPADSIAFRTLDQQCTVTRPGLSGLASNIAVELLAALTQHREGFAANFEASQASVGGGRGTALGSGDSTSPLGIVPHQIRGYLADFRLAPAETEPLRQCICCSPPILERYRGEGIEFITRITMNSAELEELSGLKAMKEAVRDDEVMNFDEFDFDEDD